MSASADRSQRYSNVAIALHWLIALAILAMVVMGLTMAHAKLAPVDKFKLYQLHKSVGISILLLVVVRLAWRLLHRPPTLPADMPRWERRTAEATHVVLYVFMIGLPLVGWAAVSASPFNLPTVLFGVLPWPHLGFLSGLPSASKKPVAGVLELVHAYGAYALIACVLLHAAAALRHYLVIHDTILQRMIPGLPGLRAPSTPRTSR